MPVKDISACFFCTRKTRIVYPYVGIIQIRLWVKTLPVYSQPAKHQLPCCVFKIKSMNNVTIQNPTTHIRKNARYSCFPAATQLILLICVGVALFEPLENKKTCCLHASMTHQLFLFSVVLNSHYI